MAIASRVSRRDLRQGPVAALCPSACEGPGVVLTFMGCLMDLSVQNVYGLLLRSQLLPLDGAKALRERWQKEARDPDDVEQFTKWMVANQYATEYQAALLLHGHADHFFLGHYKLLDRVGKGRMAVVYEAVHRLGQHVAIKVLPPSKAKDPQTLARFRREARLARRLRHPNVVRTFEQGEDGGLHYL